MKSIQCQKTTSNVNQVNFNPNYHVTLARFTTLTVKRDSSIISNPGAQTPSCTVTSCAGVIAVQNNLCEAVINDEIIAARAPGKNMLQSCEENIQNGQNDFISSQITVIFTRK